MKLTCSLLLGAALLCGASGSKRSNIAVGATIRPKGILTALSKTQVRVAVAASPSTTVRVGTGDATCSRLTQSKPVPIAGITTVTFTPNEIRQSTTYCLTSADGAIKASAAIPVK
jgi:hypothetical protein